MTDNIMKTLFLVLPCYNEELVLKESATQLETLMSNMIEGKIISDKSKICFVNDGSTDATYEILKKLCHENPIFCAINLAGNSGHQNALMAGMVTMCDKCDAIITLDADLQHDISKIPEFWNLYLEGNEIVYGVRKSRNGEKMAKRLTGDAFFGIMKLSGAKMIKNHADFRLISSKAIRALMEFKETNLFLRGIIPSLGFKNTVVEYEEKPRLAGESKYSFGKMLKLATDGITSFSVRPLQFIACCGMLFFILSILMFVYAIFTYANSGVVQGWTSIVAAIWMLGGIQLLALSIVGEYIGKIYMETKHRPRYIIDEIIMEDNRSREK